MKFNKKNIHIVFIFLLTVSVLNGQSVFNNSVNDSDKVYGVTIDAVNNLSATVKSLGSLSKKPTTRIVFDEWIPASEYVEAINKIHPVSYIMGEILDSYYMSQYTLQQYKERVSEYLWTLGNGVDIWEIGNEINGEWLGTTSGVVAKIKAAYDTLKKYNKKTALTFYYNYECWSNPANEMFRWINENVPDSMKSGLDYVWVSYYEDDCNNYQPDWQQVFDSLHTIFPNSKLGIGECGTTTVSKKEKYIKKYYLMQVSTPNYTGGYFWWYFRQDCIPLTKYLWTVINTCIRGTDFYWNNGEQFYRQYKVH